MAHQSKPAAYDGRQAQELLKRIRARGGVKGALQMERLAKRGERHPDPEIANLALQWAQLVLSAEPTYIRPVGTKQVAAGVGLRGGDYLRPFRQGFQSLCA